MAIQLLQQTPPKHAVSHDIESVIYVALWMTAKYAKNAMTDGPRIRFFTAFDYMAHDPAGTKLDMLQAHPTRVIQPANDHLLLLLVKLVDKLVLAHTDLKIARRESMGLNGKPNKQFVAMERKVTTARKDLSTHKWLRRTLELALQNAKWKAIVDPAVKPIDICSNTTLIRLSKRKQDELEQSCAQSNSRRIPF